MSVILANGVAAGIFAVLIVLTVMGIFATISEESGIGVVILLVVLCALLAGFGYSTTHFVVPANETAIVVDMKTGQTIGGLRSPGVTSKSWTQKKWIYPGQTSYQWCPVVTPSVKGGAEVETIICFTIDASNVDWEQQYRKYNGGEQIVLNGWLTEYIQSTIASSVALFTPQQLTDERRAVEKAIADNSSQWFIDNGITVMAIKLRNWKFTSAQMTEAYEASQVSVAKINAAENERKAAEIQVQTALLRSQACLAAGFTDQQFCLGFLQLQWLQNLGTLPSNFVLSLGSSVPSVSFPVQTPAVGE